MARCDFVTATKRACSAAFKHALVSVVETPHSYFEGTATKRVRSVALKHALVKGKGKGVGVVAEDCIAEDCIAEG